MYKLILNEGIFTTKEKLKRVVKYYLKLRGARIPWQKVFKRVFSQFPKYGQACSKEVEEEHIAYWKKFQSKCDLSTLRLCSNLSGVDDYRYIPEDIFVADIEPTLNNIPEANFFNFKSFYNQWFDKQYLATNFIHNISGQWFNTNMDLIEFSDVRKIAQDLTYPVVVKPNKDTYGGNGVSICDLPEKLIERIEDESDILVQEFIYQHEFYQQFNPCGINSMRVNLYKSVRDNNWHVVNRSIRMGVGGSLDNISAGGIACLIKPDGHLNGFALNKNGEKYYTHPDTKIPFDIELIELEEMERAAKQIASKIFYTRIVSLDMCLDHKGQWRLIEVNVNSTTIRASQHHGGLFFGKYTDEVVEYCITNHWALQKEYKFRELLS